ncbi:hypothetical protein AWENTII_008016 [Aspergillus wentii]
MIKDIASTPGVQIQSSARFQQVLANGKPVVIKGSDIGPCTERWNKGIPGQHRWQRSQVVVHETGPENMNFQPENFSYTHQTLWYYLG